MTPEQRLAAWQYATMITNKNTTIDANPDEQEGFDETPGGVWVRAWVRVPAAAIPGYSMEPPAPPAVVKTVRTPPITD